MLMLEVLFKQYSEIEDLFCGAPYSSEPRCLSLVKNDFHDFAWMSDKPDDSVVLAEP